MLADEIRRNGLDYEFVERVNDVAIYKHFEKKSIHPKTISFEVFIIKDEKFPDHKDRWTYSTLNETNTEEALKKAKNKLHKLNFSQKKF